MAYWLGKSEPSAWSWDQQVKAGTKGTEWLLIKKQDDAVVKGYDIDQYDESVLTGRSMADIAGDQGSAKWTSSRPVSRGAVKAPW